MDFDSDSAFTQTKEARNYAKFYQKWVRNNFKSNLEGREVGENRDYILIVSPGQTKTEIHREATDDDKKEYRSEWSAYQEGKEQRASGTPIEMLPGLPVGMADGLKAKYIHTIEQLANLSDTAKQNLGMGANDLCLKAKAYLQKNTAEVVELKQNLALKEMQIESLLKRVEALEAPKAPVKRAKKTQEAVQ